jgi:hypothetical protein
LAVPRYLGGQLVPRKVEPRHGFGRRAVEIQTQTMFIQARRARRVHAAPVPYLVLRSLTSYTLASMDLF